MTSLKDKYVAAMEAKSNDVNSFVWKGPKEDFCGQKIQREVRLVDATDEQLKSFYWHCISMLYSTNPVNPGRFTLIDKIQEDREKCNTELYLRYLENTYRTETDRPRYPRFQYLQDMKKWLSRNSVDVPQSSYYETPITTVISNVPEEFSRLTVGMIIDGCLDQLDRIVKKPITLNFILNLGVWFTADELVDLTEKDPVTGKTRDRKDVVIERLGLKNNAKIKIDPKGLTYNELRSMLRLKNSRFSELTTDQLLVLRNKVLFILEQEMAIHAELWLEKLRQLNKVAEMRGLNLDEK
jgi:hypothetical protein